MYSEKTLEMFKNPHNMGKIEDADGTAKVGSPICGDVMEFYIKVKGNLIVDIKFETFGCAAAVATGGMITDLAKGKTLDEALKITRDDIVTALGGLPPVKAHCSELAIDALKAAIEDCKKRSGAP